MYIRAHIGVHPREPAVLPRPTQLYIRAHIVVYPRTHRCTSAQKIIENTKLHMMYNYNATECTNYIEPVVQKKSFSKPINMGSSFEDLDARISNMKTVRNSKIRF